MRRRWTACFLAALLTLLAAAPAVLAAPSAGAGGSTTVEIEVIGKQPQPQWYNFTVTVEDEGGDPIPDVRVELYPVLADGTLGTPMTGANGKYSTDSLGQLTFQVPPPGGTYQIQVEHTGYEPYQSTSFMIDKDGAETVILKKAAVDPQPGVFTVTYRARTGGTLSGGQASEQVAAGETPKHVPNPRANTGYQFLYWVDQDGWIVKDPSKLRITADTWLYTIFEQVQPAQSHTVYYRADGGGSLSGRSSETVAHGASPRYVPQPVADGGYVFAGWEDQYGRTVSNPSRLAITADTWLYAVFTRELEEFTVYYRAEPGGRLDGARQETVSAGQTPKNVPAPSALAGYRFTGWVDQDGDQVSNPARLAIRRDTWLYARFEPILPPEQEVHTVYYWAEQGGTLSGGASSEQVAHGGYPRQTPTPTAREGYVFTGWRDQWGNGVKYPSQLPITQDIWLHACFQRTAEEEPEQPTYRPDPPPTGPSGGGGGTGSGGSGGGPVLDPEPGSELPSEDLYDVPVEPDVDSMPVQPMPEVDPEQTCSVHRWMLPCMGVSVAAYLARLLYLLIAGRKRRWEYTPEGERVGAMTR